MSPETIKYSGDKFAKDKRRYHSSVFKAKLALTAAIGDKMIAELASQYKVHPSQIVKWKKQLLESMLEIFSCRQQKDRQVQVSSLYLSKQATVVPDDVGQVVTNYGSHFQELKNTEIYMVTH